jgi:hypothetical protein
MIGRDLGLESDGGGDGMERIVIARSPDGFWRPYRQGAWMSHVRREPEAAGWERRMFDLPEGAHEGVWSVLRGGVGDEEAVAVLGSAGAIEILGPSGPLDS